MEFGRFDLEQEIASQGYAPASFDVIVSANAVHAANGSQSGATSLKGASGAGRAADFDRVDHPFRLVRYEHRLDRGVANISFDDLRVDNPLLSPPRWVSALADADFVDPGAWPRAGTAADHLGLHVLVARVSGALIPAAFAGAGQSPEAGAWPSDRVCLADDARRRIVTAAAVRAAGPVAPFIREKVMKVCGSIQDEPPARNARSDGLGFDSPMAVQLRNELGSSLRPRSPVAGDLHVRPPDHRFRSRPIWRDLVPGGGAAETVVAADGPAAVNRPLLRSLK